MLLDVAFFDLGRGGEAGAQRMPGEFPSPFALRANFDAIRPGIERTCSFGAGGKGLR
jgi:hypothetical protein